MESRSWWCQKAGIDKVNRSVLSNSNGSRKIIFGETLGFLSLTKGRRRCRSGNPTSDILAALERRFEGLHGWKTLRTFAARAKAGKRRHPPRTSGDGSGDGGAAHRRPAAGFSLGQEPGRQPIGFQRYSPLNKKRGFGVGSQNPLKSRKGSKYEESHFKSGTEMA